MVLHPPLPIAVLRTHVPASRPSVLRALGDSIPFFWCLSTDLWRTPRLHALPGRLELPRNFHWNDIWGFHRSTVAQELRSTFTETGGFGNDPWRIRARISLAPNDSRCHLDTRLTFWLRMDHVPMGTSNVKSFGFLKGQVANLH